MDCAPQWCAVQARPGFYSGNLETVDLLLSSLLFDLSDAAAVKPLS
jgi:hypothetical protein